MVGKGSSGLSVGQISEPEILAGVSWSGDVREIVRTGPSMQQKP